MFDFKIYNISRNLPPLVPSDIVVLDYVVNGKEIHKLDENISLLFSKKLIVKRDQVSQDCGNLGHLKFMIVHGRISIRKM